MINPTVTNIIYPAVSTAQAAQYQSKPNSYISDLNTQKVQQEHTQAIAQRMDVERQAGKAFADAAAEDMNWYDPPRGHIFDDWA